MFGYCIKVLVLLIISSLAPTSVVMAKVKKGLDSAGQYYDDVTADFSFEEFKKSRDEEVKRLKEEIFKMRPALEKDRSDMAKKIIDRKVAIIRERNFLDAEFDRGLDTVYQKGLALFAKKDYRQCRLEFEEIEKLHPGYKATRTYLNKLDQIPESKGRSLPQVNSSRDLASHVHHPLPLATQKEE